MADFVPDDFDAYIERERYLQNIMATSDDAKVEHCIEQLCDWARATATAMLEAGKLEPQNVVGGVLGLVGGVLADWYAINEYDIEVDDDES